MNESKQTGAVQNLLLVVLFSAALLVILGLISGIAALAGADGLTLFWRLCCILGAIVLILAAVLLMTNGKKQHKMAWWEARFPALPFTAAVLLAGVLILLAGVIVNYLTWTG